MRPLRLSCIIIIAALFLSFSISCANSTDKSDTSALAFLLPSRNYYMGLTPFPYDISGVDKVEYVYDRIQTDADLMAHHFDNGIPWDDALADTYPYTTKIMEDWAFRKSHVPAGHKLYVAINPINSMRNGLAPFWNETGDNQPLTAPWNGYAFDNADVKTAYLNYCRRIIDVGIYAMPSPPLQFDEDGASKVIACAELDVPLIWAPAPNAGTTAPASVVAVIVVGNAEVLGGLVLHQAVKAGAPFVWGAGVGAMNMRTMVDVYSSANVYTGHQAQTDLARWYGLPELRLRRPHRCQDARPAVERRGRPARLSSAPCRGPRSCTTSATSSRGCESSYESIYLGDHLVSYARGFMADLAVNDETIALDEIIAVGRGGNHLARPYTRRHFREIWQSDVFDTVMFERWRGEGSKTLLDRIRERVAALRAEPRAFTLDASVTKRLDEILAEVETNR